MTITVPLDKMSVFEKLQTMELIWDSLCREKSEIDSPLWHKDVLLKREESVKNSAENFEDWNSAKSDIAAKIKNK